MKEIIEEYLSIIIVIIIGGAVIGGLFAAFSKIVSTL